MAFTKVLPSGISSTATVVFDSINTVGVITASQIIATTGTFTGNVSVAGTITYEDVTNVDSVGVITARDTINAQRSVTVGAGLSVVGVSTFTNGPVLIGSGTSTGTASQPLQVTGGAYVSGNLGIGTTNPTAQLQINSSTSSSFYSYRNSGENSAWVVTGDSSIAALRFQNSLMHYRIGIQGSTQLVIRDVTNTGNRVAITSTGEVLVNTTTATGTASQPLQVTGGAYVSGSVGVGTTNPAPGIKLDVLGGEIKAGRVDSTNEGGQVSFGRATDNATGWYIDAYGSTSTPQLRFVDVSSAAVRAGIDSSGNFTLNSGNLVIGTSGKGIDFSATANSSATMTSELLSDYEEGTWTPVFGVESGTINITYTAQNGRYTKIGNTVFLTFEISWSARSGTGNILYISGAPYASIGNAYQGGLTRVIGLTFQTWGGTTEVQASVGSYSSSLLNFQYFSSATTNTDQRSRLTNLVAGSGSITGYAMAFV